ncbi:FadR/GntR family transcriptional regulator [Rhodococcus artemisiae]|uniref:FadR/GntR family transcriptional regulator n=1 Tax=Rhodococcus artemisiae TaxID=714159 RepID=A0ABU7LBS9_9NOCA|nr:FadR/GntR family transcriptional regulator [Rhodococcus artemisiae]MEE2058997.1 FadR/GntR family transcriptional regulator [Rhodococcus artemisiae]
MGHSTVEFEQPGDDQIADTFPVPQNDFEQLRRPRTLKMSEQVARQTVDYIIANGLKPGTRLPIESELGKLLGIGRNTLREALRLLEAWGVIEIRQGRNGGAVVRQPEPVDLRGPLTVQLLFGGAALEDILEIRLMLEPETAYLAAQKMPEAKAIELENAIERMRSVSSGTHDAFIRENKNFHAVIAEHAGNIIARSVIESIEAVFDGTAQGIGYDDNRRELVSNAHARIAEAIRQKDPERAREEMRLHLQEVDEYWAEHRGLMTDRVAWPQ